MRGQFPVEKFKDIKTPFYYYDVELLQKTLDVVKMETEKYPNFYVHYAIKANANPILLDIINRNGLGADFASKIIEATKEISMNLL